ncbi:DedA family protein [Brochothrix thermosphacta]|uniref:Cytochrome O ubiquinol oxidase n=1 Tax=Brochothrix thermosphacta TaxID=2756 RepID=A0A1D2KYQ8_BROTH|nr:DedA family protein [Brochothrix thermosphacta]SLM89890.1 DedA protein [Brachybacterium faecium]ANZ94393.1 cytochrome O ubiquinol oxidase [Brochothrix thermosphacta]ANZ97305.1 cytochrome O ubiquinol oxidase [Brochothrix thermosphacta]ATF26742.1 cytochrome O ubiquinol oxidase [Brochothrix thermosphacta]ATH86098.1 cytochrome O ubiquinol oxidase [Brochothrix thermosphacta]
MTIIQNIISFIIHIDKHLVEIINMFGVWSYVILFAIVFVETGLVIFPFLPGDSLLFAGGALAALGSFNLTTLAITFFVAAVIGDTVNYHIGKWLGTSIPKGSWLSKVISEERIAIANGFFEKHGGKTIIIARFMPFIRTFAPFVAGASHMSYRKFFMYNVIGAFIWVGLFTYAGYFFGNIPFVRDNFSTVILAIIFVSILPAVIGWIRSRITKNK